MPEDPRQPLSALLDGECSRREMRRTVDLVLDDTELSACWERYDLIGRAIRSEPIDAGARAMAERVRSALGADVVRMPDRPRRPSRAPVHARLFAPLATGLAAAVALVAVVIGPTGLVDPGSSAFSGDGPVAAVRPHEDAGSGRDTMASRSVGDLRWQQTDPVVRAKLDRLVVSHQERLSEAGLPGFVSYAAVVGYEGRP